MAKPLDVYRLAAKEAADARRWYAAQSAMAASGFDEELRQAFVRILERPGSFPEHREGTRRARLNRYPYAVIYREFDDRIAIIAVAHGKRRPAYWRRRLK
jgi:plasmid stabilization system protein ParE